ncbi:hypothetical protein EDEG_00260 [Edhazardia aedis USNM 41457]|uniref:Uncharacterized protein n=1 Tax=Edhazardia aedis (strain USNM 41457) TaxID=1003232 RepID=J9D5D9_EDHAE|nr:hypothetical protein EDEG_00260 [Edhazardia aedis USNM 41457]|eukprot:EJW02749.1 hypothetical protein EDEG_00260 [Edhazardia aedis USNM 41457]
MIASTNEMKYSTALSIRKLLGCLRINYKANKNRLVVGIALICTLGVISAGVTPASNIFVLLPNPAAPLSLLPFISLSWLLKSLNRLAEGKIKRESVILKAFDFELVGTITLYESSPSVSFNVFTTSTLCEKNIYDQKIEYYDFFRKLTNYF